MASKSRSSEELLLELLLELELELAEVVSSLRAAAALVGFDACGCEGGWFSSLFSPASFIPALAAMSEIKASMSSLSPPLLLLLLLDDASNGAVEDAVVGSLEKTPSVPLASSLAAARPTIGARMRSSSVKKSSLS